MIFVTVGTHEQPFNRLVQKMDELVGDKKITDEVFMQIGYSTYEPTHVKWERVISYEEMTKYEDMSEIIITHGGPATFMSVLSKGKTPIVVPRLEKFGEHVNDHQLDFVRKVKEHSYGIIIVEEIDTLDAAICCARNNKGFMISNTKKFVQKAEKLIRDLL